MALTLGVSSTTLSMLFNLQRLDAERSATMTRLTTGKRINSAADDPAGLIAASGLNADLARIDRALSNNQRSQAVLDTADASLMAINDLVTEIQSAVISASDPNATTAEKAAYQSTIDQSLDSIDSILATTAFNGTKLFTGTSAISPTVTDASNIIGDEHIFARDATQTASTNITVATSATSVLTVTVGTSSQSFGVIAAGDEIHFSIGGFTGSFVMSAATASKTATIAVAASGGTTFQLGTDSSTKVALDLGAGVSSSELGDAVTGLLSTLRSGSTNDISSGNLTTATSIVDKATRQVATAAARVGNYSKHQIGASIKALEAMKEGTASALSAIVDTDYAADTAELDRQDVMLQAAVSMLSRANSSAYAVLSLLGG